MFQRSPAKAAGVEETGGRHVYVTPPRGTEGAVCLGTSVSLPGASPQPGLPGVCVFQGRDLLPDLQAAVRELQNKQLGPGLDPAQPLPGLLPALREVLEGGEDPGQGLKGVGYSKRSSALGSGTGPEIPALLLQARLAAVPSRPQFSCLEKKTLDLAPSGPHSGLGSGPKTALLKRQ